MIEFGLLPNFVTTRQIRVLLRACHSKLIAPEASRALWIFAQPCGRPGCLAQTLIKPNFRSNCVSLMILWRSDSRPVAMTWITVCISRLGSAGNQFFCNASLAKAQPRLIVKQRAVHDVNVDISFFRMLKCAWQSADDFETELFPKMDRRRVCRNDEIKLHGAKAELARLT